MVQIKPQCVIIEDVIKEYETDIENGLTQKNVEQNRLKYGRNELIKEKGKTALQIFINQFKDFLIYLLFFAIIVSIIIGYYNTTQTGEEWSTEYTDAIVIAAILIVNAILGFYQGAVTLRQLRG